MSFVSVGPDGAALDADDAFTNEIAVIGSIATAPRTRSAFGTLMGDTLALLTAIPLSTRDSTQRISLQSSRRENSDEA